MRTDPEAPKHRGVSVFTIPLKDTPGLTIRPFYTMAGSRMNEVFFDNVRVPATTMVGEKDRGWYTVAHNLDFERSGIERIVQAEMLQEEVVGVLRSSNPEALENPLVRHRLAELAIEIRMERNLAYRVASMQSQGLVPTREASISKLVGSEVGQRQCRLLIDTMGHYGTLARDSKHAALRGKVLRKYLDSVANTIRAGTSEIQRNIIATRGLGLPR